MRKPPGFKVVIVPVHGEFLGYRADQPFDQILQRGRVGNLVALHQVPVEHDVEVLLKNLVIVPTQLKSLILEVDIQHPLPGYAHVLQIGHELKKEKRLPGPSRSDDRDDFLQLQRHLQHPAAEQGQRRLMKISYDPFQRRLHETCISENFPFYKES